MILLGSKLHQVASILINNLIITDIIPIESFIIAQNIQKEK